MKKKFKVTGSCLITCAMSVEAETAEKAVELANEEFGELENYAGMGGLYCLIGISDSDDEVEYNKMIFPDATPEFFEAKEIKSEE